jgi:predicted HicB family RNase H-like nuclease
MSEPRETFSIRIPVQLRWELQKRADSEGRSLSNLIIHILKEAISNER